jgi:PKD repeat protein
MAGTFAEGLTYSYSGENSWIDNIAPVGDAQMIFENASPNFGLSVSFDGGSYKTIGASYEFGGLDDSDASKEELMSVYLEFFEVLITGVTANFSASDTEVCEGDEVSYTDYSSGVVTDWYWEFEGGTPATSTEQSPTVMYAVGGTYDVSLTVTGEEGSNSMTKSDYINTMLMPEGAGDVQGNTETCQGYVEVYTVDPIGNAQDYNWVINPAEAGTLDINDNEVTITMSSDYEGAATLKVCGGNLCGDGGWSSDFTLNVNTCVGIGEVNHSNALSIYPNPNTGQFTLELEANDVLNLTILNTIGEVVYTMKDLTIDGKYNTSIDLSNVAEGVYYLRLEGNNTNTFKKIVIAR